MRSGTEWNPENCPAYTFRNSALNDVIKMKVPALSDTYIEIRKFVN